MTNVNEVLQERGNRYGDFKTHAKITMDFKELLEHHTTELNKQLDDYQIESLHMIFHKIGRIINGDPNYADSWIDIAGYAKLVSDELELKA
jgi:hypothetical protein